MNELLPTANATLPLQALALAALAGAALGAIFFGGLWWTTRRGMASPQPALWFLGSLLVRMGIALSGFHAVAGGRWEPLVACLFGFVVARAVVTHLTRPPPQGDADVSKEARHAP